MRSAPATTGSNASVGALRAPRPGILPGSGRPSVAGLVLPTGHPVLQARLGSEPAGTVPLMWATDAVDSHAGATVARLQAAFPRTGLWPLVLQADDTAPDDGRPWRSGEFDARHVTAPSSIDLRTAMSRWWATNIEDSDPENTSTLGTTAPALRTPALPQTGADPAAATRDLPGRIGLVAVARPADVPERIGWLGATNYFDPGYVTAVLRSWEDRYGAVLVRIGFDFLEVTVPRIPDAAAARTLAAEQLAFCPDQILQGDYDTSAEYVSSLIDATAVYCWWD